MPSAEARRLTEAHRLAQARLGRGTVRLMFAVWPLLRPDNLDGTFRRWLAAVAAVVNSQRPVSSELAASYVQTFRAMELGEPIPAVLADPVEPAKLATSMLVTGPVSIKANVGRGMPLDRAADIGAANSSRSAMRHVLEGGIATVLAMGATDRRARGYRRYASGNPCPYCAERDGIEFADGDIFESHDGCHCGVEPIYR